MPACDGEPGPAVRGEQALRRRDPEDHGRLRAVEGRHGVHGDARRERRAAEEAVAAGAPAPPPPWVLLNEITKAAGTYTNIDFGGVGAGDQEELHAAIRALLPTTHGSMHVRTNAAWDLPTALRFIEGLGYTQLYSIEVRGHEGTKAIRDTLVETI